MFLRLTITFAGGTPFRVVLHKDEALSIVETLTREIPDVTIAVEAATMGEIMIPA